MSHYKNTMLSVIVVFVYWIFDSTIHKIFYEEEQFEFIPSDLNELWMRLVIIVLVFFLGWYADRQSMKIKKLAKEKNAISSNTISSVTNILNEFQIKMLAFRLEVLKDSAGDYSKLKAYDKIIEETLEKINMLDLSKKTNHNNLRDIDKL